MRKQQRQAPFLIKINNQFQFLFRRSAFKEKLLQIRDLFFLLLKGFAKALAYLALFTPAYVMAYSIKSDFNTNSEIFLVLLAVLSNSLLITYTNKFFTLLISESRKGYVLTARVKSLNNSYFSNTKDGLSYKSIFSIKKDFKGHVFNHIFMNARFQYIETIKEQASFVISGLVIIEMALNIHGQFNYELLQQVLYKNFHYVALMALGIFALVKLTDIAAEYVKYKQQQRMSG
jgi:ABC-type dipeptide/oligopeptide/nickel transport system permease component